MSATEHLDVAQRLAFTLRRDLDGEVRFDPGSRHLYATDASNYRHVPLGVVLPRHAADVAATLAACREHGVGLVSRGGGTSLAGQATGPGVVLDCSAHLDRVVGVDPHARTARVEPGVVLDDLQRAVAGHGLMFGPDPSTHDRCTLGGMIGNDACGVHSLTTGRTVHNVEALDLLLADGTRLEVGRHDLAEARRVASRDDRRGELFAGLLALRGRVDDLRGEFPDIPRRVSGYQLDQLLGADHLHVARSLVGSEGTCAVVLGATLQLVDRPPHRAIVVLAYDDLPAAADHVVELCEHELLGLEALDGPLVAGSRRRGRPPSDALELLPPAGAWLLAEVGARSADAADRAAHRLAAAVAGDGGPAARVVVDPVAQRSLWRLRADGLGALTLVPGARPRLGGWEDAAVAPERLGGYLRELRDLLAEHDLDAGIYGHFGDGCVHTKIDFDHTTGAGRASFRRFVERAADLTVAHGGSLSGEHGDGQARSELLARMFSPAMLDAFREFKSLWDPDDRLNAGRIVDPLPLDADLRLADRAAMTTSARWFALADDGGDLAAATARCVGVGLCRRDQGTGTMCPSWMATHAEEHSTRGRAHLLFEMLRPDSDLEGWRDEAVADSLSLCLSCKACKSECPVDVDIATYKAEFLARRYEGRRRPADHYALGLVRWWLRLASGAPGAANAIAASPLGRLRRLAGVTTRRPPPRLAVEPFSAWWRRRGATASPGSTEGARVLLFADTFTETLEPHVGRAAVRVLEAAGHRVEVAPRPVCCGRPLFDHGMLETARRQLRRLARTLGPIAAEGVPIVGLEPSCVASLRDELPALLPDDPDARSVAAATRTLAELLDEVGWTPPRLPDGVLVHPHCHHAAVMGLDADRRVLAASGAQWRELDAGCCGLAGSFGYRAGEPYDVSVAAGEDRFAPRLRAAEQAAVVLADGYSCRTQAAHLAPGAARPRHLAEVLDEALGGAAAEEPEAGRRAGAVLGVAAAAAGVAALAAGVRRRNTHRLTR